MNTIRHHHVRPTKKKRRARRSLCIHIPTHIYWRIGSTIGSRPAESGGILGGPESGQLISHFGFDSSSACTAVTYAPNIVTMQALLDQWRPHGIRFRGFIHSHPDRSPYLSAPDIEYIGRLLNRCPYLEYFFAPIVLPGASELIPWVVFRDRPRHPVLATLRIVHASPLTKGTRS